MKPEEKEFLEGYVMASWVGRLCKQGSDERLILDGISGINQLPPSTLNRGVIAGYLSAWGF